LMRVGAGVAAVAFLAGLLWWLTLESCRASLWGHAGGAMAVAADADGRFVTGGADHRVVVWTPAGGRESASDGHAGKVEAVALGPGGRVASGSSDGVLKSGDATARAHKDGVFGLTFAGGLLYSGGGDKKVRAWDPSTLKEQFVLHGHTGRVRAVAASPDGKWVASGGSGDNRVRLWPVGKAGPARVLAGANRRVHCLAFADAGKAVAAGDRDGKVHLWDVEGGRERAAWAAHAGPVNGVAAVGEWLVTAGEDGAIHGWTLAGEKRWTRRNRPVTNALAAGTGRWFISADADGRVRLWDGP
ncbi:MAG: WD40 repeat domain-containing protein, partial [Gemmataceae bacterium]